MMSRCSAPQGKPSAGCSQLNQLKPGAALALNQQILPREQWQQQIVQEGDQILLFHVIAGG